MAAILSFLTSSFVNPILLAGSAAIAAPIMIWLINRLRTRRVDWAAIEFLRRAITKTRRRLRIEEWLLLLLRCLAIIMLAVVVARPRGKSLFAGAGEDSGKNIVLILDSSYSMGYQLGSTENDTVFQRAREQAQELIGRLTRQDRLVIGILNSQTQARMTAPRAMDSSGKLEALKLLDDPEFVVSARTTNGPSLLRALPPILERFDPPELRGRADPSRKSVFFLYDGQRSAFFNKDKLRSESLPLIAEKVSKAGGELVLVDCSDRKAANIAITSVSTRDPIVGVGIPCRFDVTIKNYNDQEAAGLNLEYYVDDLEKPLRRFSLNLAAGEERRLRPFPYEFRRSGPHRFQVRFTSDKLIVDNKRSLVIDVRDAVRVLLVNGAPRTDDRWEDEVFFVNRALDPFGADGGKGLIETEIVDANAVEDIDLALYDLVLLANVEVLSEVAVDKVETYTREGGATMFSVGDRINPSFYNTRLYRDGAGVFPVRLGDIAGRPEAENATEEAPEWQLDIVDKDYPGLAVFVDIPELYTSLKNAPFYRMYQVEALGPEKRPARVIMDFRPRAERENAIVPEGPRPPSGPALVEKDFGRGRSLVYLSTVDADWNKALIYDSFYLPFWRMLTLHLCQASVPQRQLAIGDSFEEYLTDEQYVKEVNIKRPDGQRTIQSPQRIEGEERHRLTYENTEMPGIYTVDFVGSPDNRQLYFSVNVDTAESDLSKLGKDELNAALPALKITSLESKLLRERVSDGSRGTEGNEHWREALYCVLGILVLESVLAMVFGRRRQ